MKKYVIILLVVISLMLVGCGSKKVETPKQEETKEEINLKLGSQGYTFNGESITCGSHQIQSNVVFSNEKDTDGRYKGSYELYECNEGNVNLQVAEGSYSVDDLEVTFIDSYGQKLDFEITDNDTIVLKNGTKIVQTFTK